MNVAVSCERCGRPLEVRETLPGLVATQPCPNCLMPSHRATAYQLAQIERQIAAAAARRG